MDEIEHYLTDARLARGHGVAETSFYPALINLFNAIGEELKPKVRAVLHPANRGAGLPDGALYSQDQFAAAPGDAGLAQGPLPARGVVEVKGAKIALDTLAASEQVRRYLDRYGLVLVTNLREFALVRADAHGVPRMVERCALADDEDAFWLATADPHRVGPERRHLLREFLRRALLARAPLALPEDVAWFLASYARDARLAVERADLPALARLREALETTLGIHFSDAKGDHFFRSTLVQTLFYGIFSVWVLWCDEHVPGDGAVFEWRSAAYSLAVPVIQALYTEIAAPQRLKPIGLEPILDRAADALNRVDRAAFFQRFADGRAIQYFYEPFLEAFDPDLRQQLGVWYTPPEIVRYMVERVDRALRDDLAIPDGLADDRVQILDPCCGTGAYLVEVVRLIAGRLAARGYDPHTVPLRLRDAVAKRIFGFELLPAPYVVAHMQLALLLRQLGAPAAAGTTARIILTNALSGWSEHEQPALPAFPELRQEHEDATAIKQRAEILVVIGNPPYYGFAGVAVAEERALADAYRVPRDPLTPRPQGQGLNDLYIRFFRMAERRIVEQTHRGVVSLISNYSWLDGLSHPAMRERYLEVFDDIWIDNLNGDKFKTGKVTPEGLPDPSAFSTEFNPEGIQVGTAITTLVRRQEHRGVERVRYRDLWGRTKRAELLATVQAPLTATYQDVRPVQALGYPFVPLQVRDSYMGWPRLTELFPVSFPGVQTKRDELVIDIDRDRLVKRMLHYFDSEISHRSIGQLYKKSMEQTEQFAPVVTRDYLIKRGFLPKYVIRHMYRPFDLRWLYWEPETGLLGRKVPEYFAQQFEGNQWLVSQHKPRREWSAPQIIESIGCLDLMDRGATCVPLYLRGESATGQARQASFLDGAVAGPTRPNLSAAAAAYLDGVGADAATLFAHVVATLHAPAYRAENAGALRMDWPRVPLPVAGAGLRTSAELGRRVAALLDVEARSPLDLAAGWGAIGAPSRDDGAPLTDADLAVAAGWGSLNDGVVMPGQGRAPLRDRTPAERADLARLAAAHGLDHATLERLLGERVRDVYLNGWTAWRNVPEAVWSYTLGGYQVIKKWLSYRERAILGRPLTLAELADDVPGMARRIAALLALGPALDASYLALAADARPFP